MASVPSRAVLGTALQLLLQSWPLLHAELSDGLGEMSALTREAALARLQNSKAHGGRHDV